MKPTVQERSQAASSAVVIGGAGGIGSAVVRQLADAGAHVHIVDTNGHVAQQLAVKLGGRASSYTADVLDEDAMQQVHERIAMNAPEVTALVNCAAAAPRRAAIEDYPADEWERNLRSHLRSTYIACRIFGSAMAQRRRGAIVNLASVLGLRSGPVLDYGAAKAGVISLTESLAVHWASAGVRVNVVAPGWTDTSFLKAPAGQPPRDFTPILNAVPQRRLMQPEEIATAVAFLLSDAASCITGIVLPCDGGYVASTGWQAYGGLPS